MGKNSRQESMRQIADAFLKVLKKKNISKITVSEVMDACGMTRQMFYHYFRDIDDLAFWIYLQHTLKFSEQFFEEENFVCSLGSSLEVMLAHKDFYFDIIKKEGPTSFSGHFFKYVMENTHRFIGRKKTSRDVEFAMNVYWHGVTACIVEWVKSGMKMPPYDMAEKFYMCLPEILKRFYE